MQAAGEDGLLGLRAVVGEHVAVEAVGLMGEQRVGLTAAHRADPHGLARLVTESLARPELSVIVARRNCLLAAADIKRYEACPE